MSGHDHLVLTGVPKVEILKQNLIRPVLFFRQPLKGLIRGRPGDKGFNDLLQSEYE
ncbi:MAG TPA: hypothetical protein VMU53_18160 [Candidatus Sulfotelmatobacter sp.]|nr:hypothetical protein [Candidatus Sulfotelmatobacter sp.]